MKLESYNLETILPAPDCMRIIRNTISEKLSDTHIPALSENTVYFKIKRTPTLLFNSFTPNIEVSIGQAEEKTSVKLMTWSAYKKESNYVFDDQFAELAKWKPQ